MGHSDLISLSLCIVISCCLGIFNFWFCCCCKHCHEFTLTLETTFENQILSWTLSDDAVRVPQRVLDCGLGLGGLNQVYGPNCPTPSAQSIGGKNNKNQNHWSKQSNTISSPSVILYIIYDRFVGHPYFS